MKYLNFTFKREATILAIIHFGMIGVGAAIGVAMYFFANPQ